MDDGMDNLLRNGPPAKELVDSVKDSRGSARRTRPKSAIIIPTHSASRLFLRSHLERLARQTSKDFDIIIVYSNDTPFMDDISALHVREKTDSGCSGAYYLGEKLALDEGYERIIIADDDCLPESDDLVEKLLASDGDVVLPDVRYGMRTVPGYLTYHYSCTKRHVFEKAGLTFLPFYYGVDDFELMERIMRSGFMLQRAETLASHRSGPSALIGGVGRRYYTARSEVECGMLTGFWRGFLLTGSYIMTGLSFLALAKRDYGLIMLKACWNGSSMRFFKEDVKNGIRLPDPVGKTIHADAVFDEYAGQQPEFWGSENATAAKVIATIAAFFDRKAFGKTILLRNRQYTLGLPQMLIAKSAYAEFEGKTYELYRSRGNVTILLSLAFLLLMLPLAASASLLLTARGIALSKIKGIRMAGYGVA